MPIKNRGRALFVGLTLAASANVVALGQQPETSRRSAVIERLPAVQSQQEPTPAAVIPAVEQQAGPLEIQPASQVPPADVPALPPEAMQSMPHGAIPDGAVAGKGNGQSPYMSDRVRYRYQKLKYRWQHYWKPGLQEHHWGYPENFCEKPLGYYLYQVARTQTANAEAAKMMLYDYDFEPDQARLNDRGREQLAKIAFLVPRNFFPVLIENTKRPHNPQLDDARRQMVVSFLQQSGFPIPNERVIVSSPLTRGWDGPETGLISEGYQESIRTGGQSSGLDTSTEISQ